MSPHDDFGERSRRPIPAPRALPTPRQPRLHRLEQIFVDDAIYFVTLCVQPRQPALDNQRVHRAFITFATEGLVRGCRVGRYVLMPDHIHAFVGFCPHHDSATPTLSAWVKALKGCVSKVWREAGTSDVQWQKGFFDHVLRTADSYAEKWDYVARNPFRAGLVSRPEDWPFQGEICRLEPPL